MIIEIWEIRFPASVDREKVEDGLRHVQKPAGREASCKMIRFAWTHTGGPMNTLTIIVEWYSFADMERRGWTVKEMQEGGPEFARVEMTRKILQVIE